MWKAEAAKGRSIDRRMVVVLNAGCSGDTFNLDKSEQMLVEVFAF